MSVLRNLLEVHVLKLVQ